MKKLNTSKSIFLVLLSFLLAHALLAQQNISYEAAFPNLRFQFPVEIQHADDGTDRLFVVEQPGRIKVFSNNRETSSSETFLDITDQVSFSTGQEIGLLGLAFHPQFADNGYFYLYHTRQSSVANINVELVLARYRVSAQNPNRADPSSRLEIFSFDKNQRQSNHNGGKIAFGPDGYLYISLGDGGGAGDPNGNAQNLNNVFGSIFRIDVDVDGSNPLESNPDAPNGNYEIPSDNPRVGRSGLDELYAWGIRNTWKFSFDNEAERMWGGDVGQNEFEEINLIRRGGNYGWNRFEADDVFRSATSLVTTPDIKPVYAYDHSNGDVSITVGYVYRGRLSNPAIQDKLIFGDYVSGRVWALTYDASSNNASAQLLFRTNGENVSSFGQDESGELYFSGYGQSAQLFRIVDEDDPDPTTVAVDGIGSWQPLTAGIAGVVEATAVEGSTVYASGSFTTAGDESANNIAVYTEGSGWQALSGGANGRISALALDADGRLYAGGDFTEIGGVAARNMAVWDGTAWQALGAGTDGPVLALGVNGDGEVYAGGAFVTAGGITVNNIARWDGSWSALTDAATGVSGTNNEVRSIAFDESNTLYIGGNFDSGGGQEANRIATFDGSAWGTLGSGTSGFVQAIEITAGFVYIGGNFAIAGGQTVNRIARWNRATNQWQKVGEGVSGNVNALEYDGTYLYAGGNFETVTASGNQRYIVNNIARWSPQGQWEALGTDRAVGTDAQINTLYRSSDGTSLYAGGSFEQAGATEASAIAQWSDDPCSLIPYVNVNTEGWNQATRVEVNVGDEVWFGPQSQEFGVVRNGWSWAGPNGVTRTRREWRITNIQASQGGTYTVTHTDPNGCVASVRFEVIVTRLVTIVDGGVYEMEPQHAVGNRLDVRGASTENSALVDMFRRNGNRNQQWKFISRGNDLYEIEPQHAPGKRLDVAGGSTANNTEIHIFQRHGSNNQLWQALPVGDGLYRFAPQNAPGNRLDIENVDGVGRALSRRLDDGNSQRWKLIAVGTTSRTADGQKPPVAASEASPSSEVLLAVYPNPVAGERFTLTLQGIQASEVAIYGITGARLYHQVIPPGEAPSLLSLRAPSEAGLYYLTTTDTQGALHTLKFIVE